MTKRTFKGKKKKVQKFMERNSTKSGKRILKARRKKGRKNLTSSDKYRSSKRKRFSKNK